jgi:hypothetical protein
LISKKFEKEIVFESSVLAWIRIEQKCWIRIRIKSIRIHNPAARHTVELDITGLAKDKRKAIHMIVKSFPQLGKQLELRGFLS